MNNDFCAFILTHGRPNNVYTYNTLIKHGYTGPVYIVIDNEDKKADEYRQVYGDKVIMFDKKKVADSIDEGDNFNDRRAIIYARNACFDIAEQLGYTYFIELDDDYTDFRYKLDNNYLHINKVDILNLDIVFSMLLKYYTSTCAKSIAIAQGGDFLGGKDGNAAKNPQFRKCMNTFILSVNKRFNFIGRINEDVNTYTRYGSIGNLFLTIPNLAIQQKSTQKTQGGMTDIYLNNGTYVKSFYTVMYSPSCTCIRLMISNHPRLHHSIAWNNAVPVIIREEYKKGVLNEMVQA
jgi:hypothetical protein